MGVEWLLHPCYVPSGTVSASPSRDQMPLDLNEQLVVEFCSR